MTYIAVLCMFGNETTTRFDEIYESFCQCPWNEFPLELQKLLPMVLLIAKEPIYLKGYMSVKCTREFMKTVIFVTKNVPFFKLK